MLARIGCQVPLADSQGENTQITRKDAQVPSILRRRRFFFFFLRMFGAYTKAEIRDSCKKCHLVLLVSSPELRGNRLSASQQNNISCHFICISKVVQGRDPQTKMGSDSGLDSGLGSAGETVASGISILVLTKRLMAPNRETLLFLKMFRTGARVVTQQ